jgi:hypothetical protein
MFSLVNSTNEQANDVAPAVSDDGADDTTNTSADDTTNTTAPDASSVSDDGVPAPAANVTTTTTVEVSVHAVSSLYAIMLCSHRLANSTI